MGTPPAYQFYARDFDAATSGWSCEEVGAYMRLLNHQWENGSIPDDPKRLARIVRVAEDYLLAVLWPILEPKFALKQEGGGLQNPRLEDVRNDQENYREQKRRAGRASAKARLGNTGNGSNAVENDESQQNKGLQGDLNTTESNGTPTGRQRNGNGNGNGTPTERQRNPQRKANPPTPTPTPTPTLTPTPNSDSEADARASEPAQSNVVGRLSSGKDSVGPDTNKAVRKKLAAAFKGHEVKFSAGDRNDVAWILATGLTVVAGGEKITPSEFEIEQAMGLLVQCREKTNPAAYFISVLANPKYPIADRAREQARRELRQAR